MTLAKTAPADPHHRCTHLYRLMPWDYGIRWAADAVLARPGSATAGVDGMTRGHFKERCEEESTMRRDSLKRKTSVPQPVRRVHIPKGAGKTRPLAIATPRDRIVHAALRALLDPIYAADCQPLSSGCRKGRWTMDAMAVLRPLCHTHVKRYEVMEGALKRYFETVHHRKRLSILTHRLANEDILALSGKFLQAGVMNHGLLARTQTGLPQGAIISPLLSHVSLHAFDTRAAAPWDVSPDARRKRREAGFGTSQLVRFADDCVVVSHGGMAEVKATKPAITGDLETTLHLELSEENTHSTHVNEGFTCLGFHSHRVQAAGRWVVHLRPAAKGTARVKEKLTSLTSSTWTWMAESTCLGTRNAIGRGWAKYYRHTSLFSDMEVLTRYTWHRYWLGLRHTHKGSRKHRLITPSTRVIHGRTRWTATRREGDQTLIASQWLATRQEFPRSRYPQKGRTGLPHPYLRQDTGTDVEYPWGETGPDECI